MEEKVSILLATYKPDLIYLRKQLESINKQDYKDLELIVCDDSDDPIQLLTIKKELESIITNLDFKLIKNKLNLGSNKTFERLTTMATGAYIAYCDQDDIWEVDKLTKLIKKINKEKALVCYSDLSIIDGNDKLISSSFKKISKRLNHVTGDEKYKYFLRRNSITGCTMLIKTDIAKSSLPFPNYDEYVHDHWLALYASSKGRVAYVEEPLVRYRLHSNNQIGAKVLNGIKTKEDYLANKLFTEKKKIQFLKKRNLSNGNISIEREIRKFEDFINTRINFFENYNLRNTILFFTKTLFDPVLIVFEFLLKSLPESLAIKLINKAKS